MYERFTDRTRKVMQLANQEAQRLNHEYIGTEHLLLGLVKEGQGVAGIILRDWVGLREIRMAIEKHTQPGPDHVTMGKLPQTPRAKKVIELAMNNARELGHNYIGTEHLLLGLLDEKEGIAFQVLNDAEVTKEEVLKFVGSDDRQELEQKLEQKLIDRRCQERNQKVHRVAAILLSHFTGEKDSATTLSEIRQAVL